MCKEISVEQLKEIVMRLSGKYHFSFGLNEKVNSQMSLTLYIEETKIKIDLETLDDRYTRDFLRELNEKLAGTNYFVSSARNGHENYKYTATINISKLFED